MLEKAFNPSVLPSVYVVLEYIAISNDFAMDSVCCLYGVIENKKGSSRAKQY